MTPAFASPEQVRGEPVTTATDVYALGLLLHEILTGRRGQPVDDLSPAELERRVCEVAPEPAGVAALAGEDAPERAAARGGVSPERLRRLLEGDLETILSKALQKEPQRRYPSPASLSDDLERHRTGLPVLARRDTRLYRAAKFVRRHRWGVAAASFAAIALLAGLGLALVGLGRAWRAERQAASEAETARQVIDFLVELFNISDPGEARGNSVTARELLDRGAASMDRQLGDRPDVRARLLHVMGLTYKELGLYRPAVDLLEKELAAQAGLHGPESAETVPVLLQLSHVKLALGSYKEARELAERAVAIEEKRPGPPRKELAHAFGRLGSAQWFLGNLPEALGNLERSLTILEAILGPDHRDLGGPLNNVASVLWQQGNIEKARPLFERALDLFVRADGEDHPDVARTLNNLGILHLLARDTTRSRDAHERALAIRRKVLAPSHPEIAESLHNLGDALRRAKELPRAREVLEEALRIREEVLGPEHPLTATTLANLGLALAALGDDRAAQPLLERCLAVQEKKLGGKHFLGMYALAGLAGIDQRAGRNAEAELRYRRAIELGERSLGPDHPDVQEVRRSLASFLER
jgi:serine/threonine-protein kinase